MAVEPAEARKAARRAEEQAAIRPFDNLGWPEGAKATPAGPESRSCYSKHQSSPSSSINTGCSTKIMFKRLQIKCKSEHRWWWQYFCFLFLIIKESTNHTMPKQKKKNYMTRSYKIESFLNVLMILLSQHTKKNLFSVKIKTSHWKIIIIFMLCISVFNLFSNECVGYSSSSSFRSRARYILISTFTF